MMNRIPMTRAGIEKLRQELEHLKRERRPQVVQAIAEAREHGDLKENAEYHAAREQQGLIEAKIKQIEHRLAHAHVIDITKMTNNGKVIFGATIALKDLSTDAVERYQIVGEDEADIKHNKISVTSPLARALVGKYEGEEVEVATPQGHYQYLIQEVLYI